MSVTVDRRSLAVAPERTVRQRHEALQRANRVRQQRADVKRRLRLGEVKVAGLIADPPEWLLTMRVMDLLRAVPGWGDVKAQVFLRAVGVSPVKTVGGLSARQRGVLVDKLGGGR